MNKFKKVVFDVDGTLINLDNTPRYDIIAIFRSFEALGCVMYIHSGGGVEYAERVAERLGLDAHIWQKGDPSMEYDIAFDDNFDEHNLSYKKQKNYINTKTMIIV